MRLIFHVALLILYITASNSSIYTNVKGSLSRYLKNSLRSIRDSFKHYEDQEQTTDRSRFEIKHNDIGRTASDVVSKKPKAIIRIFKSTNDNGYIHPRRGGVKAPSDVVTSKDIFSRIDRTKDEPYRLDPVLNNIKRRWRDFRRKDSTDGSDSSSSSREMQNWKNEWKEHWVKKKLEAINATDQPRGDIVNMVAARPWGVPCGDPNQHDMPWGNCMLAMECDSEYRIYRGDFLCGRTKFVCCAIAANNYDMYQGFDLSFAESGISTDSEEQRNRGKGSKEKRGRKKAREKKKRKRDRDKRKKNIKKDIKKIISEIRKILNRQYRNGTTQRKRKTKQLKKFIKDLKKKYKQDRKSVKTIHAIELVKIDEALKTRLKELSVLNKNFVHNATFRSIIINGTITRQGARMLVQAYPELISYFTDNTRRTGNVDKPNDYLDYDIEYGLLYY